jgi:hypothetical protein
MMKHTMTQGVFPFKYEEEKKDTGITAMAGLPLYLDLAIVFGHRETLGWRNRSTILKK